MRQDIRYALRILAQNPGFAAVAVLSLAARSPEQLVVLARNPEKPSASFDYPDYRYIRDHNQSYSGVIASSEGSSLAFAVPGEKGTSAEVAPVARVSGNYFEMLGVTPAIGRLFTPEDNVTEGAHPIVILSYDLWQRRFAGQA